MALSKREKGIATLTVAVVGTLGVYQYVLSPYLDARKAVANGLQAATAQQEQGANTLQLQRRLNQEWRAMTSGGLKQDPGDAEQQLYEAVRDWGREANFTIGTSDPQRIARTNDRTQIVKLRVTGTGSTPSLSKLLWKIETSPLQVKVDEFTLTAQPQGTDNLSATLTVSTIWVRPESPQDNKAPRQAAPVRRTPAEDL